MSDSRPVHVPTDPVAARKERVDLGRNMLGSFLTAHWKDPRKRHSRNAMASEIGITRAELDAMMKGKPVKRRAGELACLWLRIEQGWFGVDDWPLRPRGRPA